MLKNRSVDKALLWISDLVCDTEHGDVSQEVPSITNVQQKSLSSKKNIYGEGFVYIYFLLM